MKGINSLVDYIASAADGLPYGDWFTSAGRMLKKAHTDMACAFFKPEESFLISIAQSSPTFNW